MHNKALWKARALQHLSLCLAVTHVFADRGDWLCGEVQKMLKRYPHTNVLGFTNGDLYSNNLTSVRDLD